MTHEGSLLFPPFDRDGFRDGVRAMSPLAVAIAVWGVVTGVAVVNAGMPVITALVFSLTIFAGSAQLAALPLLAAGAPLPVVWVTALLVNMRFVIFSAATRRYLVRLSAPQRLLAGYLNGDLGFALFTRRFGDDPESGTPEQLGYFYGLGAVNWGVWHVSSIAGILLGGLAPTTWGLDLAASLALVAVLIPMANRLPAVAGVVVAGVLSVLTVGMPMKLGLLVSVVAGVAVAVGAEMLRREVPAESPA
jgi:predicted branched-subunit amino acid permease